MKKGQLSLNLKEQKSRAKHGPKLASRMIAVLARQTCWVTRAELQEMIGLTPRECRLARNGAHGRVIYGQKGFKLTRFATPEEIRECSNAYISQIRDMQDQHRQMLKRAHHGLHSKQEVG